MFRLARAPSHAQQYSPTPFLPHGVNPSPPPSPPPSLFPSVRPAQSTEVKLSDSSATLDGAIKGRHSRKSRSVWMQMNGGEATTQGQDCCIEASSIVGPYAYYIGVIDILQEWTWNKKLERFFKTVFLRKDADGLSAIAPETYQDRFMARIGDIMNLTDESAVDPGATDSGSMILEPAALAGKSASEARLLDAQRRGSRVGSSAAGGAGGEQERGLVAELPGTAAHAQASGGGNSRGSAVRFGEPPSPSLGGSDDSEADDGLRSIGIAVGGAVGPKPMSRDEFEQRRKSVTSVTDRPSVSNIGAGANFSSSESGLAAAAVERGSSTCTVRSSAQLSKVDPASRQKSQDFGDFSGF